MRSLLKCVRLEFDQGFSELLALSKRCGPVVVVAAAVEADSLAREQRVGNQGDGQFRDGLERTVGAGYAEFEDGLAHISSLRVGLFHRL